MLSVQMRYKQETSRVSLRQSPTSKDVNVIYGVESRYQATTGEDKTD
jgi:hypothetical protein